MLIKLMSFILGVVLAYVLVDTPINYVMYDQTNIQTHTPTRQLQHK